jgi:hypothetical protein
VSSLRGCRFRSGLFVVLAAERDDAYPVTVATAVGVCDAQAATAPVLVGVGCGALVTGEVGGSTVAGQEVTAVTDAGHGQPSMPRTEARKLGPPLARAVTPAVAVGSSFCSASVLIIESLNRANSGGFRGV